MSLFSKPSAEQEQRARGALARIFDDLGNPRGKLEVARKSGEPAVVIEFGNEDDVGEARKTTAVREFRRRVTEAAMGVADVRPVTVNHWQQFGFSQHAGVALYLEKPTFMLNAKIWLLDCAR